MCTDDYLIPRLERALSPHCAIKALEGEAFAGDDVVRSRRHPERGGGLPSPVLVHKLPSLTLLPVSAPRSAPAEAEHRQGMHPEADAPANERPIEPPSPAHQDVYDEQGDVDKHVCARVDVEAF